MMSLLPYLFLARVQTQLFFVRHGETLANATGKYSSATLNEFSTKGKQEIRDLTHDLLKKGPFDLILVSPAPRALKTIFPYLERTRQKAYVWPLLYECCTQKRPKNARATLFRFGPKISVPKSLENDFITMRNESNLPDAPTYNAGLAQVNAAVAEFNRSYRGKRILIVGHSGQGGHFIHALTGKWKKLDNGKLETIVLQ